jgi:hypothetical protein
MGAEPDWPMGAARAKLNRKITHEMSACCATKPQPTENREGAHGYRTKRHPHTWSSRNPGFTSVYSACWCSHSASAPVFHFFRHPHQQAGRSAATRGAKELKFKEINPAKFAPHRRRITPSLKGDAQTAPSAPVSALRPLPSPGHALRCRDSGPTGEAGARSR